MPRTTSKHIVRVFNPNRDPSVAEMLKLEQAADARVVEVIARGHYGLVTTPAGTFCLNYEGKGPRRPINKMGVPIEFFVSRKVVEQPVYEKFEFTLLATATYTLAECEAYLTGESLRLDEFILEQPSNKYDQQFEAWEKLLG